MPDTAPISVSTLVAFVPVTDFARAIDFYVKTLGLTLVAEQAPFALVLDANGTTIRATLVSSFTPQPFTVLGWHVVDIAATVGVLTEAGVVFNRYPGINESDPLGIWTAPGGTQVAWFNDPFGNVLSLQSTNP